MDAPKILVRRATVDDLETLRRLWSETRLPVQELEKRLTEFQVAVTEVGEILGAVGFRVANRHGHIHSEASLRPDLEDSFRPLWWERFQNLAHNFGLARLWTTEQAPFWLRYAGFKTSTADDRKYLPSAFGLASERWLTLKLREETHPGLTLDQELDLVLQAHKQTVDDIRRRARWWKNLITAAAVLIFVAMVLAGLYLLRFRTTPLR